MYYKERLLHIQALSADIPRTYYKEYHIDTLEDIVAYLMETDLQDSELQAQIESLEALLEHMQVKHRKTYKEFAYGLHNIQEDLRLRYQVSKKNYYRNKYLIIGGLLFGLPILSTYMAINPVVACIFFVATFLLSYALGRQREVKAIHTKKVY